MSRTRCYLLLVCLTLGALRLQAQVTTAQADNARTGAYIHEKQLTLSNVNASSFGKLYSRTVDGAIFAQPLYLPGLNIPKIGKRNIIFVATEHDTVYAFDLNGTSDAPLWKASLLGPASTPVPAQEVNCPFIQPEVGITSTPVIDPSTGSIYVLARSKQSGRYLQKLHALDIITGAEKFGGPVLIQASVKGSGTGSVSGEINFDPRRENPRAALLLAGGQVYLTWGSSCDVGPYHGWVMAYDAHTLKRTAVLNVTPTGGEGGIWQSDAGPAADIDGNIFVATGNGDFNAGSGGSGRNYGDTLLKLDGKSLAVRDYFTPFNQKQLNDNDLDLGSQGPVLLPDQSGPHPHMLVVAGKEGKLYVIDRDHLGQYQSGKDDVIQTIQVEGAYGAAAYWNGHVYFTDDSHTTRDFAIENGQLSLKATTSKLGASAATPAVSADGTENAIVWVVATKEWDQSFKEKPAVLHAYEAKNITHEIYNSEQRSERDRARMTVRFAIPTVADGHILLGTRGRLDVYGLLPK